VFEPRPLSEQREELNNLGVEDITGSNEKGLDSIHLEIQSKVFGMSTLYAKEENHRNSFWGSSTKSGSDATSFGLKSKRVQSFRKSIKTLVISKHVGTGTDATNPILNSSTRSSSRDP
jgi:hypothetical protein